MEELDVEVQWTLLPDSESEVKEYCSGHELDFLTNPEHRDCPFRWRSRSNSSTFYQDCLKKYDVWGLRQKAKAATQDLQILAFEIQRATEEKGTLEVGGGSAMIAGGALGILGGISVFLTPASSALFLFYGIGAVLGGVGALTAIGGSLATLPGQYPENKISESMKQLHEVKNISQEIVSFLTLYCDDDRLQGLHYRPIHYQDLKSKNIPQLNIPPHMINRLLQLKNLGLRALSVLRTLPASLDVALGIWSVVEGSQKLNSTFHQHILLTSRKLAIDIDDLYDVYAETMETENLKQPRPAEKTLRQIYSVEIEVIEDNWDWYSGVFLTFRDYSVRGHCSTKSHSFSAGWTTFNTYEDLRDCQFKEFNISSLTVSVHSNQNSLKDTVIISTIQVSTDGNSLPSLTADLKGPVMVSGTTESQHFNFTELKVLKAIKTRTSNQPHSQSVHGVELRLKFDDNTTVPIRKGSSFNDKQCNFSSFCHFINF